MAHGSGKITQPRFKQLRRLSRSSSGLSLRGYQRARAWYR